MLKFKIAILIFIGVVASVTGCALTTLQNKVPELSQLDSSSLAMIGKTDIIKGVEKFSTEKLPKDQWSQWQCFGLVNLSYSVYPLDTYNGKDKTAALNSIWHIDSVSDKLYKTQTPKEYIFKKKEMKKNVIHSTSLQVEPGSKGTIKVNGFVYERHEIGDSTERELKDYIKTIQTTATNIYPESSHLWLLSDVADLFIGLTNLMFFENYNMGELEAAIQRESDSVIFYAGKKQIGRVLFEVSVEPLYIVDKTKKQCAKVESKPEAPQPTLLPKPEPQPTPAPGSGT